MNNKDISYYMTLPYNMIVEVVESSPPNYYGTIQELPGCFANGKSEIELRENMEKAKNKYFVKLFQQEEIIPVPGDMTLRDWDLSIPRSSRVRVRLKGWEDEITFTNK